MPGLAQGFVSGEMTAAVVILLEAVEVEQQHGAAACALVADAVEQAAQAQLEMGLVVEAGQTVGYRGLAQIVEVFGLDDQRVLHNAGNAVEVVEEGRTQSRARFASLFEAAPVLHGPLPVSAARLVVEVGSHQHLQRLTVGRIALTVRCFLNARHEQVLVLGIFCEQVVCGALHVSPCQ